jgi:hypothetical protein
MKYLITTYICGETGAIIQEIVQNAITIPTFMILERNKEDLIDYLIDNSSVLNSLLKGKSYDDIQIDFKRDNLKILVSDYLPLFSLSLVEFDDLYPLEGLDYGATDDIEIFSD